MNRSENTGKSTSECLQLLLTELRHLRQGIPPELRTDGVLHTKIIQACQDLPACYKPSETLGGLVDDLISSISTWEKQRKKAAEIMFTDRRYHQQQSTYGSSKQTPFRRPPSQEPSHGRTTSYRPPSKQYTSKKCFVCRNEGCWSSNHSKEEQEESKKRYRTKILQHYDRNTRQYITDYEGTGEDETPDPDPEENDLEETVQTLMIDSGTPPPPLSRNNPNCSSHL